jgi:hypothetical protein
MQSLSTSIQAETLKNPSPTTLEAINPHTVLQHPNLAALALVCCPVYFDAWALIDPPVRIVGNSNRRLNFALC